MKGLDHRGEHLVPLVVFCVLVSVLGCAEHPELTAYPARTITPSDTVLSIFTDTLGDVLSIGEFQMDQGRVLVLDNAAHKVFYIDLQTDSTSSLGSSGEAPGDLMNPVSLVSCGGIVRVVDASNGLVCYGSDREYLEELSYFDSNLPLDLRPAGGSGFLGLRSANSFDDNNALVAEVSVGLYGDSSASLVEYYCFDQPMDLEEVGNSFYRVMSALRYASDESNGDVYVSRSSVDGMSITGFHREGDEFATYNEDCDRVERNAAEVESELIALESHPLMGAFSSMIEIDEFKPQVASIGVDSLGNVWLETAASDYPTFLVLSHSLEDTVMFVRAPTLTDATSHFDIRIGSSGIIACETREDGGSTLFLMEFEEP